MPLNATFFSARAPGSISEAQSRAIYAALLKAEFLDERGYLDQNPRWVVGACCTRWRMSSARMLDVFPWTRTSGRGGVGWRCGRGCGPEARLQTVMAPRCFCVCAQGSAAAVFQTVRLSTAALSTAAPLSLHVAGAACM